MVAAAILKIASLAINHRPIVRFQRNFVRGRRTGQKCKRVKSILKIVKSPYLSEKLSDFDEIWYTISDIEPGYSHVPVLRQLHWLPVRQRVEYRTRLHAWYTSRWLVRHLHT